MINKTEYKVLCMIHSFTLKYGYTAFTQKWVAEKLKISERYVRRILKSLKDKNMITIIKFKNRKTYRINYDQVAIYSGKVEVGYVINNLKTVLERLQKVPIVVPIPVPIPLPTKPTACKVSRQPNINNKVINIENIPKKIINDSYTTLINNLSCRNVTKPMAISERVSLTENPISASPKFGREFVSNSFCGIINWENIQVKNFTMLLEDFNKSKERMDMEVKQLHYELLRKKDVTKLKAEDFYKYFFLVCHNYNYKMKYLFRKKDAGIIKKIQSVFTDEELKEFLDYTISRWERLANELHFKCLSPNLHTLYYKMNDIYLKFQNYKKQNIQIKQGQKANLRRT